MNEKIKKGLFSFLYRMAFAACVFALLMLLKKTVPDFFKSCSTVWTHNADLKAAITHFKELLGDIMPF